MPTVDRRALLLGAAATALAAPAVLAQTAKLNLFAHRVHRTVAAGTVGGDITEAFTRRTGTAVEWTTFETGPLQDRLFREATLPQTSVDIGFLLNTQITPRAVQLFEPLDDYLARDGIEEIGDIFPGLLEGMRIDGKLYGLPYRHASSGLHYNAALFEERGIAGPPATIEQFMDAAKRSVHTRDGQPVVGLVLPSLGYADVVAFARAWDGDFITQDMRVVANEAPMVTAVAALRGLYQAGAYPRNFAAIRGEDANVWMQTGRTTMTLGGMGRNSIYNDPARSQFPGRIRTTVLPIAEALRSRYEVAPTKVEFWGMAIPRNSANKAQAWSLMREIASKENTLRAALNGNGPVRSSTYDDPRIREMLPFAEDERRVLRVSRVPLPAFDNAARAGDMFREECEAAVLGRKQPQQAMDDLARRVRPLVGAG